ncbi:MAG TPA: hypothetical protein VHB73_06095 [Alphaproteobacteria bacterium]|nr:hypothetical protein [Alphaproteobacteria bacterium]
MADIVTLKYSQLPITTVILGPDENGKEIFTLKGRHKEGPGELNLSVPKEALEKIIEGFDPNSWKQFRAAETLEILTLASQPGADMSNLWLNYSQNGAEVLTIARPIEKVHKRWHRAFNEYKKYAPIGKPVDISLTFSDDDIVEATGKAAFMPSALADFSQAAGEVSLESSTILRLPGGREVQVIVSTPSLTGFDAPAEEAAAAPAGPAEAPTGTFFGFDERAAAEPFAPQNLNGIPFAEGQPITEAPKLMAGFNEPAP